MTTKLTLIQANWEEARVRRALEPYESQSDKETVAEDEVISIHTA